MRTRQKRATDLSPEEIGRGCIIAGFISWLHAHRGTLPTDGEEMDALIIHYLKFDRDATSADWQRITEPFRRK